MAGLVDETRLLVGTIGAMLCLAACLVGLTYAADSLRGSDPVVYEDAPRQDVDLHLSSPESVIR